jgi:hypothetical protein
MMNNVFACAALVVGSLAVQEQPKTVKPSTAEPERVSVCALQRDPAAYDHKLLEVAGLVSHRFEHFVLSGADCAQDPRVWLEYGGNMNSSTIYCCGTAAGAKRDATLVVEGITIPLLDDALFRRFDARIRAGRDARFRAGLVGRFFAGEKVDTANGGFWGGYGHIGCCSLLVIQQVVSVDGRPVSRSRP